MVKSLTSYSVDQNLRDASESGECHDGSDTFDSDDDNVRYMLADQDTDADWSDEGTATESSTDYSDHDTAESLDEDGEWKKTAFIPPGVDFDNIHVVSKEPFLDSGSPVDFFNRFFNQEVIHNLV